MYVYVCMYVLNAQKGPLFDVNLLDELCLSGDLWASLELPENPHLPLDHSKLNFPGKPSPPPLPSPSLPPGQ